MIIYDKTYQIRDGNLAIAYEKLPEGVLRFEVHCERAYIQRIEKEADTTDTLELLWLLTNKSQDKIIDHFSRCFPDTKFMRMEELEKQIKESTFKRENRDTIDLLRK